MLISVHWTCWSKCSMSASLRYEVIPVQRSCFRDCCFSAPRTNILLSHHLTVFRMAHWLVVPWQWELLVGQEVVLSRVCRAGIAIVGVEGCGTRANDGGGALAGTIHLNDECALVHAKCKLRFSFCSDISYSHSQISSQFSSAHYCTKR